MDRIERTSEKVQELFRQSAAGEEGTDPEFMQILQRYIFGQLCYTGILDNRMREMVTITVLTVIQTLPQLKAHLAACLNVDAVSYNAVIQEQSIGIHYNVGKSVLDYVKNQEDFVFTDGFVQLPVRPGLGVDVCEELVEEENKTPHNWKNPVWRHADGSVAEW